MNKKNIPRSPYTKKLQPVHNAISRDDQTEGSLPRVSNDYYTNNRVVHDNIIQNERTDHNVPLEVQNNNDISHTQDMNVTYKTVRRRNREQQMYREMQRRTRRRSYSNQQYRGLYPTFEPPVNILEPTLFTDYLVPDTDERVRDNTNNDVSDSYILHRDDTHVPHVNTSKKRATSHENSIFQHDSIHRFNFVDNIDNKLPAIQGIQPTETPLHAFSFMHNNDTSQRYEVQREGRVVRDSRIYNMNPDVLPFWTDKVTHDMHTQAQGNILSLHRVHTVNIHPHTSYKQCDRCTQYQRDIDASNDRYMKSRKEVELLNERSMQQSREIDALNNRCNEYIRDLHSLNKRCEDNDRDRDSLNKRCSEYIRDIDSLNNRCNEYSKNIQLSNDRCAQYARDIEALNSRCTQYTKEIDTLHKDMNSSISTHDTSVYNICSDIKNTLVNINSTTTGIKNTISNISASNNPMDSSSTDMGGIVSGYRDMAGRLLMIDNMMSECMDIDDIRREKNKLIDTINVLKNQLTEYKKSYNNSIKNDNSISYDDRSNDNINDISEVPHVELSPPSNLLPKSINTHNHIDDSNSHIVYHRDNVEDDTIIIDNDIKRNDDNENREKEKGTTKENGEQQRTVDQNKTLQMLAQYISNEYCSKNKRTIHSSKQREEEDTNKNISISMTSKNHENDDLKASILEINKKIRIAYNNNIYMKQQMDKTVQDTNDIQSTIDTIASDIQHLKHTLQDIHSHIDIYDSMHVDDTLHSSHHNDNTDILKRKLLSLQRQKIEYINKYKNISHLYDSDKVNIVERLKIIKMISNTFYKKISS